MDDFERGLGRAEDTLGQNEPQIRRTLEKLDLDTSGLGVLREVQSWIRTSRPDLRRRNETIRTEQTEWGSSPNSPGGLAAFDEALYGKAAHDPDLYAAIVQVTKAAESGDVDPKTLKELEKRAGDATFAAAMMAAMGATKFRKVMAGTVQDRVNDKDPKVERLQAALGKTLGTASPRLSNAWRDELTADIGLSWREAHAVTLALGHGTFAGGFLLGTAKKMDSWYRQMAKPIAVEPGVARDLMKALSRDPSAAQDFFAGDDTAMKYYLAEGRMADDGKALGGVLEAVMLTFRDRDGSPENPSRGYLSAKLASEFIHLEAGRIEKGYPSESFVHPGSTGRILAGYISDINRVAQRGRNIAAPGVEGTDNPSVPGQETWGAQFNKKELRQVMREAFANSKAFAPVLAAQTAFTGRLLDHGAAQMATGRGDDALINNGQQIGAGFGIITDAAELANIEEGKALDETHERNMKLLMAAANTVLAFPQKGGWPIGAGVLGAWTGVIEDSAKGDAEIKARSDANAAVDQSRSLVHDLTAQAMLKHGLFGSADLPSKTHPWASLEGLEKGDDPRDNPNNFLKDGRTLMTMDEMIDKTATNSTDKFRRLEAYERWLYEGPSGKPWRNVEGPMGQGFSDAFGQYG
ncbi:hypothetical protein [Streptosporangium sp. KLBMP 9127]|nr:hypothetical protein [Streptosporangium sp. KLBMP 9127]